MTRNDIKVLIRSYLGEIEVPDELLEEFEGFWENAYSGGFDEGRVVGYEEAEEEIV